MDVSQVNHIKRTIVGLIAVAMIGAVSLPSIVSAQSDGKSQAVAQSEMWDDTDKSDAWAEWSEAHAEKSAEFEAKVGQYADEARGDLGEWGSSDVDDFTNAINESTEDYTTAVATAGTEFQAHIEQAASQAESKDKLIDAYNNAKAAYFNNLEAAKNVFASEVSQYGDEANQAKDAFIGDYNSAKDTYGNSLEELKNEFAAHLG